MIERHIAPVAGATHQREAERVPAPPQQAIALRAFSAMLAGHSFMSESTASEVRTGLHQQLKQAHNGHTAVEDVQEEVETGSAPPHAEQSGQATGNKRQGSRTRNSKRAFGDPIAASAVGEAVSELVRSGFVIRHDRGGIELLRVALPGAGAVVRAFQNSPPVAYFASNFEHARLRLSCPSQ